MGLVGTLLSGTTLAWFAPLLEQESPLLNNFEEFISEFKACFGDTNSVIVSLQQQGPSTQGIHKDPKVSLPTKFDGTRS